MVFNPQIPQSGAPWLAGWSRSHLPCEVGETLITVDFNAVDGGTEVVMRHELLPTEKAAADHTKGWTSCLNRLEAMFSS